MKKRTKLLLGAVILAIAVTAVGAVVASTRDRGPEVRIEEVARRDLASTVTASGYVQPRRQVDISADISGRVTELRVEEGQWVEEGEILLRIDPTSFEANVRRASAVVAQARAQAAQARATRIRAESELERAESLAPRNLIPPAELEQARTQLMVAEAQLEAAEHGVAQAEAGLLEAREQLRRTTIFAPMAGRVTRLNIEEGETAVVGTMNNPGSLLLTIADLSTMEARVRVGETDVPKIHVGDSASVRIDAFPDEVFPGRVTRIASSAVVAPSTRNQSTTPNQTAQAIDFEVVITLDEPPDYLRPDLTATAEIVTATRKNALAVPIIAVTVRDSAGRPFDLAQAEPAPTAEETPEVEGVFLLRGGNAEWRPVTLGIVGEWYFEVIDGVEVGDTVIAGPYATIRTLGPGSAVRLAGSAGTPATAPTP